MKARKKELALFDAIYEQMIRCLVGDLRLYKGAAMQTLSDTDCKAIDITDPKEIERLAKMFILHRIEEFNGYENVCDAALSEVEEILRKNTL